MSVPPIHRHEFRVYWDDTDAAGIVYYANYLKFAERARTEALLACGIRQTDLRERLGVVFVVREASVRFVRPARLEDQLVVTTHLVGGGRARLVLDQDVLRDGAPLARCRFELACLATNGRPTRVPHEVWVAFGGG